MTDTRRLYELWKVNGKDPLYHCEHKELTDCLVVSTTDDICDSCNGYDLGCKHYNSEGRSRG